MFGGFKKKLYLCIVIKKRKYNKSRSDDGMVDIADLKFAVHCERTGSSPVPSTKRHL